MFNEELRIENYKSFLIYICVIREICERKTKNWELKIINPF